MAHRFFFILLLFIGAYNSLKYYVHNKVNSILTNGVKFDNLEVGIFPPSVNIRNIRGLVVKDKNIISFEKVSAEISLWDLFAKEKKIDITIHKPDVVFDNSLLKGRKKKTGKKSPFKINKVTIVDGILHYDTPKLSVDVEKLNMLSFPREKTTIYRFNSPHLRVTFSIGKNKKATLKGQVICEFRKLKDSWKIGKFYWETEHIKVNVNGRVFNDGRVSINTYNQGSFRQILDPILHKLSIQDFMYVNASIDRDKDKKIDVHGEFNTNTFHIKDEEFKNLRGNIRWDNQTKRLRFENISFETDGLRISARVIKQKNKEIRLSAWNLPVAKIGRILNIHKTIPISGVVTETKVKIKGRDFRGKVQLQANPDYHQPDLFSTTGLVDFQFNSKTKFATWDAVNLETEFGKLVYINGKSTPKERTKLKLKFKADITKAQFFDKYTRYYINLPLSQWNLREGRSSVELDLVKINKDFFMEGDIHLRNFYSGIEHIDSMKGHVSTKRNITTARFDLLDKKLTGEAKFRYDKKDSDLQIFFNNIRGEAKKVLNLLEIDLSLRGQMAGDFTYSNRKGQEFPLVRGHYRAKQANFYDFIFDDINGDLEYSDAVSLKNLTFKYNDGSGNLDAYIHYGKEIYELKGKIGAIDLNRLNNEFKGRADLMFNGKGRFEKDPIQIRYRSGDIFFYTDQSFTADGEGAMRTDFSKYKLETRGRVLNGESVSPFTLRLNQEKSNYTGDFKGEVKDINLLIPWGNSKGTLDIEGQITSRADGSLRFEGHSSVRGSVLAFPNFPHALEDFSGDFIFDDLNFNLLNLKGSLGGGAVQGSGTLTIAENKLDTLFLSMSGKNSTIHLMDRTSFNVDADLNINYIKNRDKLLLTGDINVHSGLWERQVDESVYFNTNPSLSASSSIILDMLEYDLKLVGSDNIRINNALGEAIGKFNLRLTGNTDFPVILGTIETRRGTINFSGKKFDLIKGKLIFNDKFKNDPQMNIESEAFIKNYRIKFNIKGSAWSPKPELISSPPLPARDILTLISVGELFRRPTSTELSTQIGTGTTGLIASELTEQIKKRTKKIFGNYVLRFAPNIGGTTGNPIEDSSRIIVGKEISKDFLIVYSTNFSTQRQQVVYLQYQLSPSLSLIGMRNEDGRITVDLRFRKRH
jgi:hypothetical protein